MTVRLEPDDPAALKSATDKALGVDAEADKERVRSWIAAPDRWPME